MSLLGNLRRAIAGNNGQIMLSINDLCEQVEKELRQLPALPNAAQAQELLTKLKHTGTFG